jgi:hypothetical protein
MQDNQLPSLESTYQKMQMPMTPGMPAFPIPILPMTPTTPSHPAAPTAPAPTAPTAPTVPAAPARPAPAIPMTPAAPNLPPAPESEQTFPVNPLLPRILPTSSSITVPLNPVLPPQYATTLDYESLQYLNGYLRTQIGNYVEAQFLVGSNNISVMFGKLVGVGLNYILIEDMATGDISACDFYNIKFFRTHAHSNLPQPK